MWRKQKQKKQVVYCASLKAHKRNQAQWPEMMKQERKLNNFRRFQINKAALLPWRKPYFDEIRYHTDKLNHVDDNLGPSKHRELRSC
jgi:glutamine synthetase